MEHAPGAALPRSFVSDAEDIAVVLRARQVHENLRRLRRALGLVVAVGFIGLVVIVMRSSGLVKFQCRSMQSEAKGNLKSFFVAQEAFRAEYDRYGERAVEINFEPKFQKRYRYALTDVTKNGFTVWAFGIADDVTGDVWRINENNELVNLRSTCR
jgi:hypothetical protein